MVNIYFFPVLFLSCDLLNRLSGNEFSISKGNFEPWNLTPFH